MFRVVVAAFFPLSVFHFHVRLRATVAAVAVAVEPMFAHIFDA